jgi:hypothetical protein
VCRTVVAGLSLMLGVTLAYPCLSFVAQSAVASVTLFCFFYSVQSVAINFTFASGNVLVNEAALRPHIKDQVGAVNGAGHMIASAVRAIGPAFAGILWSLVTGAQIPLGYFIPFLICTLVTAAEIRLYRAM